MKHPITPPSKLLQEWMFELHFQVPHPDYGPMNPQPHWEELIERVAQWAADQELESCCEWLADAKNHGFGYDHGKLLSNKLRSALAPQGHHGVGDCLPVPEGPTDEEITNCLIDAGVDALEGESDGTDRMYWEGWNNQVLTGIRAVIAADRARWGRPTIEPVPIAERLPGPEDCDAEGRCWLHYVTGLGLHEWHFLDRYPSAESYNYYGYTHSLPHHALPVPINKDHTS